MAIAIFNQTAFLGRYPEFAAIAQASIEACFSEAGLYLNNTDGSIVTDIPTRTALLYMLTAHIVALNFGANGRPPSDVVGRISGAGQGTINVQLAMGSSNDARAWFDQTKYGAAYWQASLRFRSATYVAPVPAPTIYIPRG